MQLDDTTRSTWDVRHYGAAGDGTTDDVDAIQLAVDRCHAAGGGLVLLPSGRYRSGPISLRSKVQLHLASGARLVPDPSAEAPLIIVGDQEDVSITGAGIIDGGAAAGPLIVVERCRRVRVHDLTLVHAPGGTLRVDGCGDVELRGLTVTAATEATSGDGVEILGSQDVIISDCRLRAGAAALVVRSSADHDAPCRNVIVGRCTLSGTERGLGVEGRGVLGRGLFSDLVISDSEVGVEIAAGAGGRIEGLRFSNLIIDTTVPIAVRADAGAAVRDLAFTGMTIAATAPASLTGTAEGPLERIRLGHLDWTLPAGDASALHGRHLADLIIDGVTLRRGDAVEADARNGFVLEEARGVLVRGLHKETSKPPADVAGA